MKKVLAIVFLVLLGFLSYTSYIAFHKDRLIKQAKDSLSGTMTVNGFSTKVEGVLSYHKEFASEDTLLVFYPFVQDYLSEPKPDGGVQGHDLLALFESYEPHRPRTLLQLGGAYFALWADYGHEEDYEKGVIYFKEVQALRPNDPYSLYCLYSMYVNHGEKQAEDVKATIEQKWHDMPKGDTCALPSGL